MALIFEIDFWDVYDTHLKHRGTNELKRLFELSTKETHYHRESPRHARKLNTMIQLRRTLRSRHRLAKPNNAEHSRTWNQFLKLVHSKRKPLTYHILSRTNADNKSLIRRHEHSVTPWSQSIRRSLSESFRRCKDHRLCASWSADKQGLTSKHASKSVNTRIPTIMRRVISVYNKQRENN